jgi:hypothetical protein
MATILGTDLLPGVDWDDLTNFPIGCLNSRAFDNDPGDDWEDQDEEDGKYQSHIARPNLRLATARLAQQRSVYHRTFGQQTREAHLGAKGVLTRNGDHMPVPLISEEKLMETQNGVRTYTFNMRRAPLRLPDSWI